MAYVQGIARTTDWQSADDLTKSLKGLGLNTTCRHMQGSQFAMYVITWHSEGAEPLCYGCKPQDQCPRSGYCENRK
jgi:hypothetical protein